jgi:hypothetical protein
VELPTLGTASSSARILACVRPSHPGGRLESLVRRQARRRDEVAQSKHRARNPRRDGHDDREGRNLIPEGWELKVFRSNVCDARFPKCFWVSSSVVMYNDKINPSVWLADYHLAGMASGAGDDLFIIQFLPIYLPDSGGG